MKAGSFLPSLTLDVVHFLDLSTLPIHLQEFVYTPKVLWEIVSIFRFFAVTTSISARFDSRLPVFLRYHCNCILPPPAVSIDLFL